MAHRAPDEILVPLRKWMVDEAKKLSMSGNQRCSSYRKELILKKAIVAYCIAELSIRLKSKNSCSQSNIDNNNDVADPSSLKELQDEYSMDNFFVRMARRETLSSQNAAQSRVEHIKGVDMISPSLSLHIIEPAFLNLPLSDESSGQDGGMGRYLEVEIIEPISSSFPQTTNDIAAAVTADAERIYESSCCHLFGILLYELFSHILPFPVRTGQGIRFSAAEIDGGDGKFQEHMDKHGPDDPEARKKATADQFFDRDNSSHNNNKIPDKSYDASKPHYVPLQELGFPSSICMLVQNLIECGWEDNHRSMDAYPSLKAASDDIHLLILDPDRFLADRHESLDQSTTMAAAALAATTLITSNNIKRSVKLQFKEDKLYGREKEFSLMTDAFCRVSSGESEAFFIYGFSGCGKSALVQSVERHVKIAGGYVIAQKFDQMSKGRPMSEVMSAFNKLCLMIRDVMSLQELLDISNKLREVFEADFHLLVQLLPNIHVLLPQLNDEMANEEDETDWDQADFHCVCFILKRFIRVISNKSHPVMLFLDDLQWADSTSLGVIQAILLDGKGLSFFFVGSYRDNEVQSDHTIFDLMKKLDLCNVPSTKLHLEGMNEESLNLMISDIICIFPRLSRPLSNIVFQKTKG